MNAQTLKQQGVSVKQIVPKGWEHKEAEGDLNKDGIKDLVVLAKPNFKENMKTVTVKVGNGSVDYTTYPLTSTVPSKFRYGDFFSVVFASKVDGYTTALDGEAEVFLNGTAVLADGSTVELTTRDDSTCMRRTGSHSYQKYIFPTHYFGLPKGTKITDLYLYFTNKDGSKTVKPSGSNLGFRFKQNNK